MKVKLKKNNCLWYLFICIPIQMFLVPSLNAQKPYTLNELDQFIKVERLSDRVLTIWLGNGIEGITAISTKKGIVLIDAGMNPPITEKYRKIIEKEFKRKDFAYIINTHGDQDHTFGNKVFKEATVIGHEKVTEELKKKWKENYYSIFKDDIKKFEDGIISAGENSDRGKLFRIYLYKWNELLKNIADNFIQPIPSITFSDEMSLDMGDITFKMNYFGKAHRESDIIIYLPEEKILFVGDLIYESGNLDILYDDMGKVKSGLMNKGSFAKWYSSLNTYMQPGKEIKYVINGHAGFALSKEVLMTFFNNIKSFLGKYQEGREFYDSGILGRIIEQKGVDAAVAEFRKLCKTEINKYFFIESEFIGIGYDLLTKNKSKEAIELFKMAVELFPESGNAYDSLAEAYMKAGKKEDAILNYQKSLNLDPKNNNAAEMLNKLKETK